MGDFWDEVRALEGGRDRSAATDLRDRMVGTPWSEMSFRDSVEFFNELLRLEEVFPGLLVEVAGSVLEKLERDSRCGLRQDQLSKASVLYSLSSQVAVQTLLSLGRCNRQDLDTRNAAVRIVWQREDATDEEAVAAVRDLLSELLPEAERHEDPAASFVVGLCYLLLNYAGRSDDDAGVVRRVYDLNNRGREATAEQLLTWFRTQGTCGGLRPEPMSRG